MTSSNQDFPGRIITQTKINNTEAINHLLKALNIKKPLRLTLERVPFDLMESGKKDLEFRKPSKWIKSRLCYFDGSKKQYDIVVFSNGYAKESPCFIAEYKGFFIAQSDHQVAYPGLTVHVEKGDICIKLGSILKRINI